MFRFLVTVAFILFAERGLAEDVSFRNQVAPVLAARCAGCHGGAESKGSYRVTSYLGLNAAGDTGFAPLTPGKLDESYLYELITSEDESARMPKDGEPLTGDEEPLPVTPDSRSWYRGKMEHLPLARIEPRTAKAA